MIFPVFHDFLMIFPWLLAKARISGRVTYSRLLEFVDEGSVWPGEMEEMENPFDDGNIWANYWLIIVYSITIITHYYISINIVQ